MSMLRGAIYITDDLQVIYSTKLSGTKIVSLDEDGILEANTNDIIAGTCLLPPMEAKIAEADGNEQMYDVCYSNHLLSPYQQKFITALITYLYKGGNIIIFLPEIGYNNTMMKLIQHIFRLYGIHIGKIGDTNPMIANSYYDEKCIPIWLNLMYSEMNITANEYLYMYPLDAAIENKAVINHLIIDINPYGESLEEKIDYVIGLHKKIHKDPYIIPAIYGMG